jgi:hypothetical protein
MAGRGLIVVLLLIGLCFSIPILHSIPASGFFPENPKKEVPELVATMENGKLRLYEYAGSQGMCYMIVGDLHGKTVSISCVKYGR